MYPHTFTPSTTVQVWDGYGHTANPCQAQLFKPLLGCQFNGPQPRIAGHSMPNFAASILRGLVLVPNGAGMTVKPGPTYWGSGVLPLMTLSEDVLNIVWYWLDAVPWIVPGSGTLWSVFACKDFVAAPPPPPPPPPPTPIILGGSPILSPPITYGIPYITTLTSGVPGYFYAPTATGIGYTNNTVSVTAPGVTFQAYGGSTSAIGAAEGSPIFGPGSAPVSGMVHFGPDMIGEFQYTGGGTSTVVFMATSP